MGKNVNVPRFNCDTVEFTSRERELTVIYPVDSAIRAPFEQLGPGQQLRVTKYLIQYYEKGTLRKYL